MIDYSKLGVSGNRIIFLSAIIGGLIIALGSFVGAKKNEFDASAENKKIIDDLKKDLNKETDKLSEEQKRNGLILDKIQSLQDKIDGTTEGIDEITRTTNRVVGIVKNEQRGSGKMSFRDNNFDIYSLEMASNTFSFSKKDLLQGFKIRYKEIDFTIYVQNQEFLLTTEFKDIHGDPLFDIDKGNWKLWKFSYSLNYDATGLEIVDKDGRVYLQIELVNNELEIKGAFHMKEGIFFMNNPEGKEVKFSDVNFNQKLEDNYSVFERNFKHGDIELLGERSEGYHKRRKAKEEIEKAKRDEEERYRKLPPKEIVAEAEKFIIWFEKAIVTWNTNPIKETEGIYEEYKTEIQKKLILTREILKKDFTEYNQIENPILGNLYEAFIPVGPREMNAIIKDLNLLLDNYKNDNGL